MKKTPRFYMVKGDQLLHLVGVMQCGDLDDDELPEIEEEYGITFSEYGNEGDLFMVLLEAKKAYHKAYNLLKKELKEKITDGR